MESVKNKYNTFVCRWDIARDSTLAVFQMPYMYFVRSLGYKDECDVEINGKAIYSPLIKIIKGDLK